MDENAEILKKRAVELAKPEKTKEASLTDLEVIVFKLGDEVYAIELKYIREVHPLKGLESLPCAPSFVMGIINIRRKILSVVNLLEFLKIQSAGIRQLSKVLILQMDEMEFGIAVETIEDIRRVLQADIQESLPTLTGARQKYLKGVTQETLIILDGAKLLTDEEIIVNHLR